MGPMWVDPVADARSIVYQCLEREARSKRGEKPAVVALSLPGGGSHRDDVFASMSPSGARTASSSPAVADALTSANGGPSAAAVGLWVLGVLVWTAVIGWFFALRWMFA